ncbi:MAG: hypothetical protein HY067_02240 [Betaproteobacteria bacterium]|nr:hypothetical protein [Betaproteobacteria bacterium]
MMHSPIRARSFVATLGILVVWLNIAAGCGGHYEVREKIDRTRYKTVYVEKFENDEFDMRPRLEQQMVVLGFETTGEKAKADLTLVWRYTHAMLGTNASVRLVNAEGRTVYLGEGDNPGFGTALNKTGAVWGCFERALGGLR